MSSILQKRPPAVKRSIAVAAIVAAAAVLLVSVQPLVAQVVYRSPLQSLSGTGGAAPRGSSMLSSFNRYSSGISDLSAGSVSQSKNLLSVDTRTSRSAGSRPSAGMAGRRIGAQKAPMNMKSLIASVAGSSASGFGAAPIGRTLYLERSSVPKRRNFRQTPRFKLAKQLLKDSISSTPTSRSPVSPSGPAVFSGLGLAGQRGITNGRSLSNSPKATSSISQGKKLGTTIRSGSLFQSPLKRGAFR